MGSIEWPTGMRHPITHFEVNVVEIAAAPTPGVGTAPEYPVAYRPLLGSGATDILDLVQAVGEIASLSSRITRSLVPDNDSASVTPAGPDPTIQISQRRGGSVLSPTDDLISASDISMILSRYNNKFYEETNDCLY
jgi:hypothetical protein